MSGRKRKYYRKGDKGVIKVNHGLRDAISGDFSYNNPTPYASVGFIEENIQNKGVEFEEPIDIRPNEDYYEFQLKEDSSKITVKVPFGLSMPYNFTTHSQEWKTMRTIGRLPVDADSELENMYETLREGIIFEDNDSSLEELNDKLYAQELYLFHALRSAMISLSIMTGVSPVELFESVLPSGRDQLLYGINDYDLSELSDFISTLGIIRDLSNNQLSKNGYAVGQKLSRIASTDVLNKIDMDEIDRRYFEVISPEQRLSYTDVFGASEEPLYVLKNPAVEDTISKIKKNEKIIS